MKSNFLVLFIIINILCIPIANATGGFYLGLGAGYATLHNTPNGSYTFRDNSTLAANDNNLATAIYWGYDLNRYFGLQVNYNVAFNGYMNGTYSTVQQNYGPSIIGYIPMQKANADLTGIYLYGKLGYDFVILNTFGSGPPCNTCNLSQSSMRGYAPLYGGGIEYRPSAVSYRLEYNYVDSISSSQIIASSSQYLLSILYHF